MSLEQGGSVFRLHVRHFGSWPFRAEDGGENWCSLGFIDTEWTEILMTVFSAGV